MSETSRGRRWVARICGYAHIRARQATSRNQHWLFVNWCEVERVVLDAYYGADDDAGAFRRVALPPTPSQPRVRTRGQIEMQQAPLRRVRRIEPRAVRPARGEPPVTIAREQLSCGHVYVNYAYDEGAKPARRRRCYKCRRENVIPFHAPARRVANA